MIGPSALTVFMLGLRHGADPDHLAAIDNVTRNSYEKTPLLSRFVGTMFASGHSVMVLAISALVGFLGARFAQHGALLETIGTWVSIVVLVAIGILNLRQLLQGKYTEGIRGAKTRLIPKRLREGTSALVAIPIGLLFGLGFETSSQIASYAIVIGSDSGPIGAVIVGAMFCLGMIVTDTLDSLIVHRLIAYRGDRLPRVMRVWLASVTALAFAVAGYESAQLFGWQSPIDDLAVSGILVGTICLVFVYVVYATRRTALPEPPTSLSAPGEIRR
jgi:high-affinity nickel-transport protein